MSNNFRNFNQINKRELDEFVSEFAFNLYHNMFLDKEFHISKIELRRKFLQFFNEKGILYDRNQDKKIGSILNDSNILYKATSDSFCLKFSKIFEYERSILDKCDNEQISKTENRTLLQQITDQKADDYEVEKDSPSEMLEFQSCVKTKKNNQFVETNFACYICQRNLLPSDLQDHIPIHNDMTDFEWLRNNASDLNANFEMSYQICRNQYYLKFTVKTEKRNIKIHRIITIKSNSIATLKWKDEDNDILKYGSCSFPVDRHIFNIDTEQPVVIIYQMENINEIYIEHYLMPLKDLPPLDTLTLPEYLSKAIPRRSELSRPKLKDYHPESKLKQFYSQKNRKDVLMMYNNSINEYINNEKRLSRSNIADVLKFLVQLEDIETQNLYLNLTQFQATIKGFGRDFSVKLNTPKSIVVEDVLAPGDEVILKCTDTDADKKKKGKIVFHGSINRIYGKNVCFEIRKVKSHTISIHKKYNIEFRPNRLNFKYQYSSIEMLENNPQLKSFLFPSICIFDTATITSLKIVNKSVEENPEQKQAVLNIVNGVTYMPYIIIGPPGTGKTTTIVESILQVKLCHPKECRIVVTAGSNAACDEVGKRLAKLIENTNEIGHIKMLRIYAKSVEKRLDNIDENLVAASNLVYGDHFYPSLETMGIYDVIICTMSVLGRLKSSGMPANFFSYCFIDECAASTEPEVLVAITAVYHSKINIVIAGDHKQLGPILKSQMAAEFGLKNSLMERLLDIDCYLVDEDDNYNQRIQTRLVRNFRTHSDILQISNNLFYSNSLIACAPKEITHWATNWCRLPKTGVPIIFYCANGYTKKDEFSTSLYNMKEVNLVMDYVKKLMYFKKVDGRDINEKDIGIISPYKKQNVIIREELDKRHWYDIATGSVETFQGQEKPIIIISTVRSMFSNKSGPGFLDSPKRLNVMLTRAQALLIIVGNLELLQTIKNWKEAINYFEIKEVLTDSNYIKSKSIVPESNYLHFSKSLQNLSIVDNTKKASRQGHRRRKNLKKKNVENLRNGTPEENKVESWLNENKHFQKKYLSVNEQNEKSTSSNFDSGSTSGIPNPLNSDFFNSTVVHDYNIQDSIGYGSTSAIHAKIETTKRTEISKEQTKLYTEKPINANDLYVACGSFSSNKNDRINSSNDEAIHKIKFNSFATSSTTTSNQNTTPSVWTTSPASLLNQKNQKLKKKKNSSCSIC